MPIDDYDGKRRAVSTVQRQLEEKLDTIRRNKSYSEAGRKAEMAKAVLDARSRVSTMKLEFINDRNSRRNNLYRIAFGNVGKPSAIELIAMRDAQDRASKLRSSDDASALLHRANQTGDETLAKAAAQRAFECQWADVLEAYADVYGKRNAIDLLSEMNEGPNTQLADTLVFQIRNPKELASVSDADLRELADRRAPGM